MSASAVVLTTLAVRIASRATRGKLVHVPLDEGPDVEAVEADDPLAENAQLAVGEPAVRRAAPDPLRLVRLSTPSEVGAIGSGGSPALPQGERFP
jgi:hypothetical protein